MGEARAARRRAEPAGSPAAGAAPSPRTGEATASGTLFAVLAPASVVALAAVFALRRLDDFDTWWHLAAGRWIVEHGRVPDTDTLSHTVPDHAWINLQWLYDVVLYGLHRLGGADLLVLASAACFTAAFAIAMRAALAVSGPLVASAVGLGAVLVAEERFMIRPEMATFVLLAAAIGLLLTARRDEGRRLWLLPVLMLAWVNVHALFVVGLVCIAGFGAGASAARAGLLPAEWRRGSDPGPAAARRLWLYGGLAAAATLVNPFFVRGALFPLELLSRIDGSNAAFQAIGEFRTPFSGYFTTWSIGAYQAYFFAAGALLFGAAIAGLSRPRAAGDDAPRFDVGAALVFCALAYLSTLARRNIGLFALGSLPIVASWVAVLADRTGAAHALARGARGRAAERTGSAVIAVACLALAVFVATNRYYRASGVTREFGLGVFEANFPMHAASFAQEAGLPGKLYNDLTAGGYLTWHAGVEGGVYIDGRLEVYDTEFFTRYSAALNDVGAWLRDADARGVQTAVLFHRWPNRHNLIRFLARDPGWASVYFDETAAVFVRRRGNEAALARAAGASPAAETRTRERLAAGLSGWHVPIERAVALESYARLLATLGAADGALDAWQRVLALDALAPEAEASVRFSIAWLLASRGERASARLHAEEAVRLAPENQQVRELLRRLGT